jgi:TetR/AcrR family transcriptional regulator, transcriptional repressor for nem operon
MMIIMRYAESHKPAVRERIVEAASRAMRRHGIDGLGIPALMQLAGLSHGAFYTHFQDRDELVVAAVEHAAAETADSVFAEGASIEAVAARYLSAAHSAHRERGCVIAALAAESTHQPAAIRHAFGRIGRGFIALFQRVMHPRAASASLPSDRALVTAATMVGAVILSRIVEDEQLATKLLEAARASIKKAA